MQKFYRALKQSNINLSLYRPMSTNCYPIYKFWIKPIKQGWASAGKP